MCNISVVIVDESSEEEIKDETEADNDDPIQKYKMLLEDIEKKEDKKMNKDMEMEITWGVGVKDKAEELVKKKLNEGKGFIILLLLVKIKDTQIF